MAPLKKDSSANYDQGTGKYRTRSEELGERTVTAPGVESTHRVSAASEADAKAVEADTAENKSVAPKKTARKSK